MRTPVDVPQRTESTPALSPSTDVPEVAAVLGPSLTASAVTASPSPALPKGLTPEQRASFLRVWNRLPTHFATLLSIHLARRGPLSLSNNYATFSVSLRTFVPDPNRTLNIVL